MVFYEYIFAGNRKSGNRKAYRVGIILNFIFMKTPNIFNYATSELSQDAFLCYLIQWASPEYQKTDEHLNQLAISFVLELLEKDNSYKIEKVEVKKQWHNIDVCAFINNEYFIVIENKKGTKEHSNQLQRYAEHAKNYAKNENLQVKLIYFKMEEQSNLKNVETAGFSLFERAKMLPLLEKYTKETKIKNDIVFDYYFYLFDLDEKINSYKNLPLENWHWFSWQGFYSELQEKLGEGEWNYVANPSGGFLGFWFYGNKIVEGEPEEKYLQFEQKKFCFKIAVRNKTKRRELRNRVHREIMEESQKQGIKVKKPARFGNGNYMTVAILDEECRQIKTDGTLDMQKTIAYIEKLKKLITPK